jgi:acetyl-CoA synthetase
MTIPIAWRPDANGLSRARLTKFIAQCGAASFEELYLRSIDDVAWFTEQMLQFLEVRFDPPYEKVLDTSQGPEWSRWCVGGGLNISQCCLEGKPSHQPAISWEGEEGDTRSLSYRALKVLVQKCAAGLRALGVGKGDCVGVHLPMMAEAVIAMLALARIGAVAVPLFTGFGPSAIETRLQDTGARVIITANAFPRRGKRIAAKQAVDEAAARCPALRHIVVVERMDRVDDEKISEREIRWNDMLAMGSDSSIEPTLATDPLLIIYSSGTTGRPKGIVHVHGGFPIKAAADMTFHFDVHARSRIAWVTDIGWMMGPWLIYGALLLGGTIALYDGAPDYPHTARLWAFADRQALHVLGVSPTLIRSLAVHGTELVHRFDLSHLRFFGSTGEPWNPEPWYWLFDAVGKRKIPIINYSGGSEISGGILCNNPLLPVKATGFAAPCLGMAADVVDENGQSVRGQVGELVIRKPWLGMAAGFHNDPERYVETYWSTFPGIWRHGDFAEIDEDGHWFIQGRSDDTIKVAGKRVGPAEIESVLVGHPEVIEAAAVAIPDPRKGNAIAAFVVVRNGSVRPDLAGELKDLVAAELGKPLRPEVLKCVPAIPKTRNGKLMRRLVRAAWLDEPVGDISALENPDAVEAIRAAR